MSEGINEQQLISISGNPNGGDWLLGFRGEMCDPPLKYNANATDMTAALCALSTVGNGNLSVVKRAGGPLYDAYFSGALGHQDVPLLDVDDTGLNRGGVSIYAVIEGSAATPSGTTLIDSLTTKENANATAHAELVDQQLLVTQDKREAMSAVPPEKRPL